MNDILVHEDTGHDIINMKRYNHNTNSVIMHLKYYFHGFIRHYPIQTQRMKKYKIKYKKLKSVSRFSINP